MQVTKSTLWELNWDVSLKWTAANKELRLHDSDQDINIDLDPQNIDGLIHALYQIKDEIEAIEALQPPVAINQ